MGLGSLSSLKINHSKIKVHINNDGEIVAIEKEENGFWTSDTKLKSSLERLPKILNINKKAIITIIQ